MLSNAQWDVNHIINNHPWRNPASLQYNSLQYWYGRCSYTEFNNKIESFRILAINDYGLYQISLYLYDCWTAPMDIRVMGSPATTRKSLKNLKRSNDRHEYGRVRLCGVKMPAMRRSNPPMGPIWARKRTMEWPIQETKHGVAGTHNQWTYVFTSRMHRIVIFFFHIYPRELTLWAPPEVHKCILHMVSQSDCS